jgi:curli biogenesis system outer membrane secretion channel CsgG
MTKSLRVAIAAGLAVYAAWGQPAPQKKRIAVLNFDFGTVQSGLAAIFGANVDVGSGIADLIVERLVESGVYSVYERKSLDKILTEQNFSNSDRADAASAAKIGRLLGVDAIVIGSVTQFGRDDKQTNIGGGALGGIAGRYGLGGVGRREAKAVVGISARIVDIDTGEIKAIASGKGESSRSGTTLLGAGGSSSGGGGGAYDMRSSNFANSILGEATKQAVMMLSQQLNGNAGRIQGKVLKVDGMVADVSGNTLVLNVGSRSGVRVGDKLSIRRMSREIKDPATGKVIRRVEETLGEVTITEVDEQSSVGTFSGVSAPKTGDTVKSN